MAKESVLDGISCGWGADHDSAVSTKKEHKHNHKHNHKHDDEHHHHHDHDHDHNHELDYSNIEYEENLKFIPFVKKNIALILAFILFFIALIFVKHETAKLVIFLAAYILAARKVLIRAFKNILKGNMFDENFLMSIASIVAFLIGEYAEGVAVMLFYGVGELTEDYAINKSKKSISLLLDLKPDFAFVKEGNELIKKDPSDVKIGDIVVVKAGEKIPVDGIIIKGNTTVDNSMLTGESLPVYVEEGSNVFSGTINVDGLVEIKVTEEFSNSAVSKIMEMVAKANDNKAKTERFITKFAKVYTPIVVVLVALIAIIPVVFLGEELSKWLYRGSVFLVVSCPCALVISVPLGYFGGIGGAAKNGVLVKGGQYFEVLKQTKTIIFDKTGTLTKGNFEVDEIIFEENVDQNEVLKIMAHIESTSNHPIAKAIVKKYKGEIDSSLVSDIKEIAGKGIEGKYLDKYVQIGKYLDDERYADRVGTLLYLLVDGNLQATFVINDQIKDETEKGLSELRKLGINTFVMLTGDRKNIAENIGNKLGIDKVYSELMPQDKLKILEDYLKTNENVVFVGDGINDAPVLSRADIGVSMSNLGSDIAIESSDVVLMNDEITGIVSAIKVSKYTSKIIWQNIIVALSVKIFIMILGALGIASLWLAILGDVGLAFLAILNSGRTVLRKY